MRRIKQQLMVAIFAMSVSILSVADRLEETFQNPPHPAKPWVCWINMDGHLTKEGITADFEAMKAAGIGGMIHEGILSRPRPNCYLSAAGPGAFDGSGRVARQGKG